MTTTLMISCINLRARYGDRFRITFDPAYSPRHVPREKLDPWMMQLPCRFGTIYPHGGELLAVEVDYHPRAVKALRTIPGIVPYLDGNGEKTFLFHPDQFDQVAAIVQPKKRRRPMTEAQRQACIEHLAKMRAQMPA